MGVRGCERWRRVWRMQWLGGAARQRRRAGKRRAETECVRVGEVSSEVTKMRRLRKFWPVSVSAASAETELVCRCKSSQRIQIFRISGIRWPHGE